jgi:hypothetical protein
MAIYVNIKKQRYLKDFLILLYSIHNDNGYLTCIESFKDELCTIKQCKANKYRSIDEILEIVNTYYPSITIKRLAKVLHNLIIKKNNYTYYFHSLYCSKVEKTTTLFTKFKCDFTSKTKGYSKLSSKEFYELSKL